MSTADSISATRAMSNGEPSLLRKRCLRTHCSVPASQRSLPSTSTCQRSSLNVNADADASTANVHAAVRSNVAMRSPPSRPPAPVTTPGRASRARHPLPLKNIHHWRSSGAGARRPKKYRKYFTGFLSVWQSRRRRLAATVGLSKNPTICRRGSPTPASARQAWSCARIYCLVPQRFLSAAGQDGRERDARLVRQIAGTRRDHDPNSEAA